MEQGAHVTAAPLLTPVGATQNQAMLRLVPNCPRISHIPASMRPSSNEYLAASPNEESKHFVSFAAVLQRP